MIAGGKIDAGSQGLLALFNRQTHFDEVWS
jgi:hypothetical protein